MQRKIIILANFPELFLIPIEKSTYFKYMAIDIAKNRKDLADLEAGSMKKKSLILKEASMED